MLPSSSLAPGPASPGASELLGSIAARGGYDLRYCPGELGISEAEPPGDGKTATTAAFGVPRDRHRPPRPSRCLSNPLDGRCGRGSDEIDYLVPIQVLSAAERSGDPIDRCASDFERCNRPRPLLVYGGGEATGCPGIVV